MARTEEQKRTRAPITVRLGDKDYQIQIPTRPKSIAWRAKLVEQMGAILENFEINTTDSKVLSRGLMAAMLHFPEKLAELVSAYAPNLEKEILQEASEEQVASAF